MAKRPTTEDHLAQMKQWRGEQKSDAAVERLHELLKTKLHGLVIKRAAELALQWNARDLADDLQSAAAAIAVPPDNTKRDPGCEGKTAVLKTLVEWDVEAPDFYLAATRWTQPEGIIKGSTDTAAECRGLAAIGLAQSRADDTIIRLADLLADKEAVTRQHAALALGVYRGNEAVPLLRLKARLGDESADVVGEALAALLRHDPRGQLSFVLEFLDHADARIIEAAAVAAAGSHSDEALAPLTATFAKYQRHPVHTSLLMAIALLRTEASLDWFLRELAKASPTAATSMLDALRIYRGDTRVVTKIRALVDTRPTLAETITEIFGSDR